MAAARSDGPAGKAIVREISPLGTSLHENWLGKHGADSAAVRQPATSKQYTLTEHVPAFPRFTGHLHLKNRYVRDQYFLIDICSS